MKRVPLCPECSHAPSGRYNDGLRCYCACHDAADGVGALRERLTLLHGALVRLFGAEVMRGAYSDEDRREVLAMVRQTLEEESRWISLEKEMEG